MDLLEMIQVRIEADYDWDSPGIIRIGENRDIAAYLSGNCRGRRLIFCHGNGESAVSEKRWFDELATAGVTVVCPDYRGYGLSEGNFSEQGCYEAAHAAYDFLLNETGARREEIFVAGYSLGSAIAVELAASEIIGGLILEAPFLNGEELKRFWLDGKNLPENGAVETSFPTSDRLPRIQAPTLVIHGAKDDVVPFAQGKAVYDRLASKEKRFIPVKGAGHADFKSRLGFSYVHILLNFISPCEGAVDHPINSDDVAN